MNREVRWVSSDLESLPDDGKRYEIIDGELYMSKQPHYFHQVVCATITAILHAWNKLTRAGSVSQAPGLIFAADDDAVPDVSWISLIRLQLALQPDGKLHSAPELVVEVLSPGSANEQRDRDVKLKLYSRRGVDEYWVVNWQERHIEVYRRSGATLRLAQTLSEADRLTSAVLPGFACQVADFFADL